MEIGGWGRIIEWDLKHPSNHANWADSVSDKKQVRERGIREWKKASSAGRYHAGFL